MPIPPLLPRASRSASTASFGSWLPLVTKGMTRKEQILSLSGIGLQPKEIASILGISANQASVTIYDAKQAAAKPQQKKTAKA